MSSSNVGRQVLHGVVWTVGPYALSIALRFGTNIISSRLLSPEVFGVMVIVVTLRTGVELLTDLGIGQSVVHNQAAEDKDFLSTAWTMQVVRGLCLGMLLIIGSFPSSYLYDISPQYIQFTGLILVIAGFTSPALLLMQKRLRIAAHNLLDLALDFVGSLVLLSLCWFYPSVWAILFTNIFNSTLRVAVSFWLLDQPIRFRIDPRFAKEISSFGKWIFLSSTLSFLCANFDKLFLAKVVPLAVLGVFGMARSIADLGPGVAARLGHMLLFPLISARNPDGPPDVQAAISHTRWRLLLVGALGLAFGINVSDVFIEHAFDPRYHAASWMLPILLLGSWITILSYLAEYTLLGLGRPDLGTLGNGTKLGFYLVGLPVAFYFGGVAGAVIFVAVSDCVRYVPIVLSLRGTEFNFLRQDAAASLLLAALVILGSAIRVGLGFGTPLDGLLG